MTLSSQMNEASKVCRISLSERFDFHCVREFREAYEAVKDQGVKHFDVDFSKTGFIDSSALGMLVNMERYYKEFGVSIELSNCNEQVKKILLIARFDKKFDISFQ
ncbi:STAS domain-containing protein [Marinibactrum halimedae]|uniref:Anti-anti-sigma regulatory factor n=1 Tax=Marinibactrum halimedae TaxID=1444977 RepID=A0AA37WN98_9GAMM|nr:STAS domain-containing protein [Marinibactrum halimedae]MCD9460873.1 STAS domain-containing protein [Marinibactrum halimedae]GLS27348.1 anti-anti-sigma regulatory factor [Marinibactrum halimedae]